MATTTGGREEEDCPSIGVEAVSLDRFADIETEDGHRLVYDRDNGDAWVQSDLHIAREMMV